MARAQGLEPQPAVLETVMLPLHQARIYKAQLEHNAGLEPATSNLEDLRPTNWTNHAINDSLLYVPLISFIFYCIYIITKIFIKIN